MANVQPQFEEFHRRIRTDYDMNVTLRQKRDIILGRIRRHLADNSLPGFSELHQGSYKMKTGVVPIEMDYDIDIGLRFGIRESDYPAAEVRGWVFDAVNGHTDKVESKPSCVRVYYGAGYHLDLVSYAWWEDAFGRQQFRLAHESDGWRPADPPALLDYINGARGRFANTEDGPTKTDQFRRLVRCIRRWEDEAIRGESPDKPSGLAFVLLCAERLACVRSWDGTPDDAAALRQIARSLGSTLGRITAQKPTPEYEEMFARLSDRAMADLVRRFGRMADALEYAHREPDLRKACLRLREEEFGPDFPVPDPEETARKTAAPAIVTDSSSA